MAPVLLAEPVTKLSSVELISILCDDSDSPNGFALKVDREKDAGPRIARDSHPLHSIFVCVWVWEHIRQVAPDEPIVPVPNK